MNNVLKLSGSFFSRKSPGTPGAPTLPVTESVDAGKLLKLAYELEQIRDDWKEGYVPKNILVSVYYKRIIPKSGRTQRILAANSKGADFTVVGSKFGKSADGTVRHIVTHCVSEVILDRSIEELKLAARITEREFGGFVNHDNLANVNTESNRKTYANLFKKYDISRSRFSQIVVDVCLVEKYGIELKEREEIIGPAIVTLYDTGEQITDLLDALDISYKRQMVLDATTVVLSEVEYALLFDKAPYLIAMTSQDTVNWTDRLPDDAETRYTEPSIPAPTNEPTIGVIDTLFKKDGVYFSDWVEFHDLVDPEIDRSEDSYVHGTKVTSIIVDGPNLTPWLDDGCGRFRVRHFGITNGVTLSLLSVLELLPQIIRRNPDIRVWNLSLGSPHSISDNSVSPVAALLDQLQHDYNVVFVVAGTNDSNPVPGTTRKIGSPADSINSLVVNSVRRDGSPASYSRQGPALSFFGKPDICFFGGDHGETLTAYAPWGEAPAKGTSIAAPWIARKLAYLIEVVGLKRETAKALLIDSASGWSHSPNALIKGYGVVPTHINDVLYTNDDEIKFIVTGKSTMFDTYTYRIPVPINKGKHPYYAKATLCYFPQCSRNQGVDYTNTELDLRIGRLSQGKIKPIDDNMQGEPGAFINEETAREYFRKWDNVKVVAEEVKERKCPRKVYDSEYWGISLKAKERFNNTGFRSEVDFGIVVTLKEMYGVNRIDEFIRRCEFAQWRVTKLDVEQSLDVYIAADDEIEFDE